MPGQLFLKPTFNAFRQQMSFPTDSFNVFMREELTDTISYYQKRYGVFSFMRLTKLQKFVIHTMKGQPFLWQPHLNCSWDETGSLKINTKEMEPCKAKLNEGWCYDELFKSCYQHFLTYRPNSATLELDENGIKLVNDMVRTIGENALLGAMLVLTVGQLFDPAKVSFNKKTNGTIKDLFERTMSTCKGWVELVREMGTIPAYMHMNYPGIFKADEFRGKRFIGDIFDTFDRLRAQAPDELESMLDEGAMIDSVNDLGMPIIITANSFYKAVADEWRRMCISNTCLNSRLTMEEETVTIKGRSRKIKNYYIDSIPVVPISHINYADKYLNGSTHLLAITVAGNINLGSSLAPISDDLDSEDVGIMIEREQGAKNHGKFYMLAHALFSVAIANTDLYVGTQEFGEYAKA